MKPSLNLILETPQRQIYHLQTMNPQKPAVFLLMDKEIGGVLINTPEYTETSKILLEPFSIKTIFFPSHFGAIDVMPWKLQTSAELIAHQNECIHINGIIDIPINEKAKLTRTIDFFPITGRSHGSCALFLKNLPGIIFFGPTLQRSANGWPGILQQPDDVNFEARLFSALTIKDLKYQYAFTDDYTPELSLTGPNADREVTHNIEMLFN